MNKKGKEQRTTAKQVKWSNYEEKKTEEKEEEKTEEKTEYILNKNIIQKGKVVKKGFIVNPQDFLGFESLKKRELIEIRHGNHSHNTG